MGGITIDELIQILEHCLHGGNAESIVPHLESARSRVQHPEYSKRLGNIIGAFQVPDRNMLMVAKDPDSGKPYPNSKQLIQELLNDLKRHKKMSETAFNFNKYSQQSPNRKKKTRGNPFRVLMGKVGKLLDHGLEKREIVRYLLKEKIWNEETISKAVKIVKEYNKKKHRRVHKNHKEAQTLPNTAQDWPRLEVDFSKRSNAELITSLCWLNSLDKMDSKEVADRAGVKTMIRKIKSTLNERGMSDDDLKLIVK